MTCLMWRRTNAGRITSTLGSEIYLKAKTVIQINKMSRDKH